MHDHLYKNQRKEVTHVIGFGEVEFLVDFRFDRGGFVDGGHGLHSIFDSADSELRDGSLRGVNLSLRAIFNRAYRYLSLGCIGKRTAVLDDLSIVIRVIGSMRVIVFDEIERIRIGSSILI